jgi:hypothetical protein
MIGPDGQVSKLPDGVINTKDGRYVGGTISRNAVQEREHFIVLKDVKTRSGVWPIPNQKTHPEKQAIEIAQYVDNWLKSKLAEAKKMADNEKP